MANESSANLERLVKCLEGAQAHLLTPAKGSVDWWLKLDAHISDIIGTWLRFTPMLLRARFAQASKSPQEALNQAGEGSDSPTAPKGPQQAGKALESTPKPEPTKPVGRFEQGGPEGMGFTTPEGWPAEPACPKCQSRMTDTRLTKKNKKAPDFKCASNARPTCKGALWPNEFQSQWEDANDNAQAPDHYEFSNGAWHFCHVLTADERRAIHANAR